MKYAQLGSITHGTMVTIALIEAFSDALESLLAVQETDDYDPEHMHAALVAAVDTYDDLNETEQVDILERLTNALEAYAPPCCRFGAHEGDGSDFGFWWDHDAFVEMIRQGDIVRLNAGDDPNDAATMVKRGYEELDWNDVSYIVFVNDHGNVSLHSFTRPITTTELVSVV